MKKTGAISLALCICLLFCQLSATVVATQLPEGEQNAPAIGQEDSSVLNGSHTLDAQAPILGTTRLITNTTAAILYETNTDTLVYAWNPDMRMYPSSLVKMMTALLAVQKGSMTDIVSVKQEVISTIPDEAVSAGLKADELMSLQDLLYCMMVNSANDAAAVIAHHISGSQDAFVQEMNRYAQELGCTGTQFTNPHGLHDEEQYTTARDMAKILEEAMQNEVFVTLFSTVRGTVPATNLSEERKLSSNNFLMNNRDNLDLYLDSRVTGGRTGVTEDGDRCLAVSAQANGLQYICIVMGAKSVYEEDGYTVRSYGGFKETSALLSNGFDGYKATQIFYKDQALRQCDVAQGENGVVLGPDISVSTVLPEGAILSDLTFRYYDINQEIKAPIQKGDKVSFVQVFYNGICLAQSDLYAMNSVAVKSNTAVTDLSDRTNGIWTGILIGIIVVLVIVVLGWIVLRILRRMQFVSNRNRSRRYRRGRRRSR